MIKKSFIRNSAFLAAAAAALLLVAGQSAEVSAQRDPFKKAGWATPKKPVVAKPGTGMTAKAPPAAYVPPTIEARIDYYKKLREAAVASGAPMPKVTSVLTLNEMAVTGIFKTPRGYAAMVEATPIQLSYTIYPGEKFFDGQLVAVEENRLVFRKVTKLSEGKFVASVENKTLREYSVRAQVEGTAPVESTDKTKPVEIATNTQPSGNDTKQGVNDSRPGVNENKPAGPAGKETKTNPNQFLSPLDEMNNQPAVDPKATEKDNKKPAKKPTKVAKNDGN